MFTVEITAIGSEILSGHVQDTNTWWLCSQITGMGGNVARCHIVGDVMADIAEVLRSSLARRPDAILTCGGLGPTADDMTLFGVARALDLDMTLHPDARTWIAQRYLDLARTGYVDSAEMTKEREKMAYLPEGGRPLPNPLGSAPGVRVLRDGLEISCLPGVPSEMKRIFEDSIAPSWRDRFGAAGFVCREIQVDCGDESFIADALRKVSEDHDEVYVKSRARSFGRDIRLTVTLSASAPDRSRAASLVDGALRSLQSAMDEIGIRLLDERD